MSTQIDERVVSLEFDNSKFEKNVQQSMSTLDKLKQSLNFKGASDSLKKTTKEANNISFDGLVNSVSNLEKRFSISGIAINTVIERMTNSLINLSKKSVSWFTQGIVAGGKKRATNLENANFQLQGLLKNEQAVADIMEDVSYGVNDTAYGLDAAASVASQLAASGMRAGEGMRHALRGISGVAAMTNSSYEDIGKIFTTVAGNGRLMGEQLLQLSSRGMNAAATLAEYLGVTEAEVRDMVSKGKIDFETFATAMDETFGEHAKKANETFSGAMSNVKSALGRIGADFYSPIIEQNGPLVKFFNALRERINELRTSVKPVVELITSLSISTINFGTSILKSLDLSKLFGGLKYSLKDKFAPIGDAVDKVLKPFKTAVEGVDKAVSAVNTTVTTVTSTVKDLGPIVDDVILGKFGNGAERFNALTAAGYNWCEVQNKVNEKLGSTYRYTQAQVDEQNKLLGIQQTSVVTVTEAAGATEGLTDENKKLIKELAKLSDAQLAEKGYTEDQIDAIDQLRTMADKLGISLEELIDNYDEIDGKWLVLKSLQKIGKSIVKVFKAVGKAFTQVFTPLSDETVFDGITGFSRLAEVMSISDETADKITRTFKGLFSVIDLVTTIVKGGLKIAFSVLGKVLKAFNLNILDVTAYIGDALTKFHDFVLQDNILTDAIQLLADAIIFLVTKLKDLYDSLMDLPQTQKVIDWIKQAFTDIWHLDLKETGKNIVVGLGDGIKNGIKDIPSLITDLGELIITTIEKILDIHSPSRVMYRVGKNIIQGLVNGITETAGIAIKGVYDIANQIVDGFRSLNLETNKIVLVGFGATVAKLSYMGLTALNNFSEVPMAVANILNNTAGIVGAVKNTIVACQEQIKYVVKYFGKLEKGVYKNLKAKAFKTRTEGVLDLAKALLIVASAIYLMAQIDTKKLWNAVGAITVLTVILVGAAIALNKLASTSLTINKEAGVLNTTKLTVSLLTIAASVMVMANALKVLSKLSPDELETGIVALSGVVIGLYVLLKGLSEVQAESLKSVDKVSKAMLKMSVALLLIVGVMKLAGMLSKDEFDKGIEVMAVFAAFVAALCFVGSKFKDNEIDKVASAMIKLTVALGLLVIVCKLAGTLTPNEFIRGGIAIVALGAMTALMVGITNFASNKEINDISKMMVSMGVALLLTVAAVKLCGYLDINAIKKAIPVFAMMAILIVTMVSATTIAKDKTIANISRNITALGIAIGIMVAVTIILGYVKLENLIKGVAAATMIGLVTAAMIAAMRNVKNIYKEMITFSVAIGVMALAVAGLSFIDAKKLYSAVGAISILMLTFGTMAKMTGKMNDVYKNLIVLASFVLVISGVLIALSLLPNPASLINVAASLSLCLLSLTASVKLLSGVSGVGKQALASMALLGMIMTLLGGVLYAINGMDGTNAVLQATALSELILALSGACLVLSYISPMCKGSMATIAELMLIVTGVSAVIVVIAGVLGKIKGIETLLDEGIIVLGKIGEGIGSFIGGIVDGAITGALSGIVSIADNLSDFASHITPFAITMKTYGSDLLIAMASMIGMLALLTGAEFVDFISEVATFGLADKMGSFATDICDFGDALVDFSDIISGNIDADAVKAAATAGKKLAEMSQGIDSEGGIFSAFTGTTDWDGFNKGIVGFAGAMVSFSDTINNGGGIDTGLVQTATTASESFKAIADNIPKTGGFLQTLIGETDWESFNTGIVGFADAMINFSNKVANGAIDEAAIKAAGESGQILTDLAGSVPRQNGWAQEILGEQDMETFGDSIEEFGKALTKFCRNTKVDEDKVEMVAKCGEMMATLDDAIPEDHWFDGKVTMSDFGSEISKFGEGINGFNEQIKNINAEQLSAVISQVNRMTSTAQNVINLGDTSNIATFATNMQTLAQQGITGYFSAFENCSADLDAAVQTLLAATATAITVYESMTDCSISNALKTAVESACTDISKLGPKFATAARGLMNDFAQGISTKLNTVKATIKSVIVAGISSDNQTDLYDSFKSVGSYMVDGFVEGIKNNQYKAVNQAVEMGKKAVEGAKKGTQEQSPSKATRKIGNFFVEGFVLGINDNITNAISATEGMGDSVIDTIGKTIARVAEAVSNNMDANPTITPVVDLTNVDNAADSMSSLFSSIGFSPKVSANQAGSIAGSINASTTQNQNGVKSTGNIYNNFTQNNYSPKALSRLDIYRQSRNLLASAKGVMG